MATLSKDTRSMTTTLGSDSAGPFNLGFRIFDTDGFEVFVNEVQTTDFTISASFSNGFDDTATITFGTELNSGDVVDVYGDMVADREADLPSGGMNLIAAANSELPRYAAMISELRDKFKRVIMAPKGDMGYLPSAASRSGKWLGFDAEGDWVVGTPADPGDVTISSFAETLLDDATGAAFLTSLGFTAATNDNAFGNTSDLTGSVDDTSAHLTGMYHVLSGATGTKPTTGAFALIVARETSSLIWQIAIQGSNMWVRSNTGSWSSWERMNNRGAQTLTASASASLDFTAMGGTDDFTYALDLANLVPATDSVDLCLRTSTDGGSTYDSTAGDYSHSQMALEAVVTPTPTYLGGTLDHLLLAGNVGSDVGEDGVSGRILIHGSHLTKETRITGDLFYTGASGNDVQIRLAGARLSAADVDAVQIYFDSGNIESGEATLSVLKKS